MDAIHVHIEKGGEHGKVRNNTPFKIRDKEHEVAEERTARQIPEKLLVGVVSKAERGPMDQERMKGLAKVN